MVKASAYNVGDPDSIPELGRSPGEGNGSPLQYSCVENPMDRGAWRALVYRVAKSWTQLKQLSTQGCQNLNLFISRVFHGIILSFLQGVSWRLT